MTAPPFDPVGLLAILNRHQVRYVVIGGFAAVAHGSTLPTTDVGVTPDAAPANLDRLSAALTDLEARLRVAEVPEGIRFAHSGTSLCDVTILTLVTRRGNLDLVMAPAGGAAYADLLSRALMVEVRGVSLPMADLSDIIASKRAAGRHKDLDALPMLEELEHRRRRPGSDGPPERPADAGGPAGGG